ncbi:MAG TPA: aerial mycelium formation protein [Acidimicrobiia bacterium]|nr:aerial mycelium formation protein [Acidimicrobiia bacterium]
MAKHKRRVDRVLEAGYVDDLASCSLEELRSRHSECLEIETEVSYVRRLAQARLDILRAEISRRAAGGSVGDLIAALPQILADEGPRAPVTESRLPRHLAPSMDIKWNRGLEHLVFDGTLANLPTLSDDELRETIDRLSTLERELSERRRELHRVIETIELDLAGRHKVGRT